MSKRFADMNEEQFDELIDNFIDRSSAGYGEMPAATFFDLLAERMAEKTEETLNLAVNLKDDVLVLTPDRELGDIVVRGNEILIGKHRLVLQFDRE